MYSFVQSKIQFPEDPLGKKGPNLHQFLRKSTAPPARPCPYGKKCTYGSKCKYYHSFQQKPISETLRKQAMKTQSVPIDHRPSNFLTRTRSAVETVHKEVPNTHKKLQRQLSINPSGDSRINYLSPFPLNPGLSEVWGPPVTSTSEKDNDLYTQLSKIFPPNQVRHVMDLYPGSTDASFICTEIVKIFR